MAEYYFENNKTKRNLKSFLIARSGRPWKKVWPDLEKFCHLTTTFKILGHFEIVQIAFGKIWAYFGKFYMLLGKFSWLKMEKY